MERKREGVSEGYRHRDKGEVLISLLQPRALAPGIQNREI